MRKKLWEDPLKQISPRRSFRYRQAVAGPAELHYSKAGNRLFLRVAPVGQNPRNLKKLDILIAEITALAVQKTHWRLRITSARLDVYLAFPSLCQVAVDFDAESVKKRVDRYLNQHYRRMPDSVPIPVLAYNMLARETVSSIKGADTSNEANRPAQVFDEHYPSLNRSSK